MEIVSTIALISINETLIVQLISFLIFLFLITRIMIRPLRKVMGERDHHMKKVQKEIADSKAIIDYCRRELEDRKHAVRAEARALSRKIEDEGNGEAEKIFESARQEIASLKASKAKEIACTVEAAKKRLAHESEVLAESIMEKMLDRRLNP